MYTPALKNKYKSEITPALMKQFNYKTVMQVPKLEKIVISQGLGQAIADKKILEMGLKEVTDIAGQKAVQEFGGCVSSRQEEKCRQVPGPTHSPDQVALEQ